MAKHTYYFKHDFNSHNDEKIIDLRMSQGLEGYGIFWFLIELLASADDYILENNYKRLAFSMGTKEAVLKSVVEDFGLFTLEVNGKFYSDSLVERMNRLDEIKLKRAEAGSKGGKSKANAKQLPSKPKANAKQIQADKRRVEDSKEEKKVTLFESWWNMYDKKTGKDACLKKWMKLSEYDQLAIYGVVGPYVISTPDKQYRKNPLTYLNGGHWKDEIAFNRPKQMPPLGDKIWDIEIANPKTHITEQAKYQIKDFGMPQKEAYELALEVMARGNVTA